MTILSPSGTPLTKPKIQIKFKKLNPNGIIPKQKQDDIGWDLTAIENVVLEPHKSTRVSTGICMAEVPTVRIFPKIEGRSGLACKGIFPVAGIVDRNYTGEIMPILYNGTNEPYEVKSGDRIAQLVFYFSLSCVGDLDVELVEVDEVQKTERNASGFGSSGR